MVNLSDKSWSPSYFGRLLTGSYDWTLTIRGDQYLIQVESELQKGSILEFKYVIFNKGLFWSDFDWLGPNGKDYRLDGLPNNEAALLQLSINQIISAELRNQERLQNTKLFERATKEILDWHRIAQQKIKARLTSKGWIQQSFTQELINDKPIMDIKFNHPDIVALMQLLPISVQHALKLWQSDLKKFIAGLNQKQLDVAQINSKRFFHTIEKSQLSDEQIKAVVCFDDRLLLVASAGSGKTSTMVAKCGYAIQQNYFKPEQILMLTFNKETAKELRNRVDQRLLEIDIPSEKITTKTFHAFGQDVIGICTGKKPHIPTWLESKDLEVLKELVDELKDRDFKFRTMWDLFRVVIFKDLPSFGKEKEDADWYDSKTVVTGFKTFNDETVRSRGELLIANWLFYNGVKYEYEHQYEHETADATHRQYMPDFYFPDINLYYEHWALDDSGNPPADFKGYAEGMRWKKELHASYGTDLIETTMAQIWSGEAFSILEMELTKRGIKLDPNPDRETKSRKPIQNERLIKLFRTFLTHVKSNQLSMADLHHKLETSVIGRFKFRHQVFLGLFESIWNAWEQKLQNEGAIDFDDMLIDAANHIEQGSYNSPFQLIMVDEFQDVSQSRARLLRALLNKPDQYLFAVGDDWQSINRFAGSYIGCMTDFETNFGLSTILKLENTFRCPQSLCDISSQFILKNPAQIKKTVRSAILNVEKPIKIIRVKDINFMQSATEAYLRELSESGNIKRKQRVFVLGRHNLEEAYIPKIFNQRLFSVEFKTVHSSKGLEADLIIIPNMINDNLGFPNQMEDDPVLSLAMPSIDLFEYSEERRLFYVALTRAKQKVVLITVERNESPFILELVEQHGMEFHNIYGISKSLVVCPECKKGLIVDKSSKNGPFQTCNRYPLCKYKPPKKLPS